MSKGSRLRPLEVPYEKFSNNWNQIFGKKDEKAQDKKDIPKKDDLTKNK